MNYPSKSIQKAVEALSLFPGIGEKSAMRMVLHLLKRPEPESEQLAHAISELKRNVCLCESCGNASDSKICAICDSDQRDRQLLCVVEDLQDVMAVENTAQYNGLYHVIGGLISPIDGIGPEQLFLSTINRRVKELGTKEVIIALSGNMEGDTTMYYISRMLAGSEVLVTTISKGVSVGTELEYADEVSLGRSIINRIPYHI